MSLVGFSFAQSRRIRSSGSISRLLWSWNQRSDLTAREELLAAKEAESTNTSTVKATKKAIRLAEELGLKIDDIEATGGVLRESDVLKHVERAQTLEAEVPEVELAEGFKSVVIYGAGRGAITMMETLESGAEYRAVCFLDDGVLTPRLLQGFTRASAERTAATA